MVTMQMELARGKLTDLVDYAIAGEPVVITVANGIGVQLIPVDLEDRRIQTDATSD